MERDIVLTVDIDETDFFITTCYENTTYIMEIN